MTRDATLIRLQRKGWIRGKSAVSETNRKVKLYSLTRSGTKQLDAEVDNWECTVTIVSRFLGVEP